MKNKIKDGKSTQFTAGADVASGAPVVIGNSIGIAVTDVANGKVGEADLEGVFELASDTGTAYAQGDELFWDVGNSRLTKTGTGNILAGEAESAKESAATTARVKLGSRMKQAAAIAALTGGDSPTEAEFNALVAALKAAGIMKNA